MPGAPIPIRFGGYAPPETTHGRGLARFRDVLQESLGDRVQVLPVWNILDFGYRTDDLLSLTDAGILTACYISTSILAARVPQLAVLDLPFRFDAAAPAHAALDGPLGDALTRHTEAATNFRVLGYWDNGLRHISNRLRPVRTPADVAGMRIRLQSNVWHERLFRALGAEPVAVDLKVGIPMIAAGEVDAQENPMANTITYGVHEHHRHVSLTAHLFGARGLYLNALTFDAWPADVQDAVRAAAREAVRSQRAQAGAAEDAARATLEATGATILDLSDAERDAFRAATAPVVDAFRREQGEDLLDLAR